jgi:hypothetical protein
VQEVTRNVLGNYEILDNLGERGMGEVWRARARRLHRSGEAFGGKVPGLPVGVVYGWLDCGIGLSETIVGWRQDSRSAVPETIHPAQPVLEIHDLHVTPDGQAYAYNYVTIQSDLYVAHGLN